MKKNTRYFYLKYFEYIPINMNISTIFTMNQKFPFYSLCITKKQLPRPGFYGILMPLFLTESSFMQMRILLKKN